MPTDSHFPKTKDGHSACVRSGYCCKKATCVVGLRHGAPEIGCTFLRGDGPGRYSCGLIEDTLVRRITLFIGDGCCSSMNTDRAIALPHYLEKNS